MLRLFWPKIDKRLQKLKKKMDWVLVDAPCSGTGTFRSQSHMKWKTKIGIPERLIGQQRTIFEQALSYLAPQGKIIYGTCSILQEENQLQVDYFCQNYQLEVMGKPLITLPTEGGTDGFYG